MAELTQDQMLDLGVGKDFWRTQAYPEADVPELTVSDGPSGLRYQKPEKNAQDMRYSEPATCYPALATLGATWDEGLAAQVGHAIGEEALSYGVGVVLGPGLNIKRSPLGGRNFEYLSEDPLLAGALGSSYVRGLQETGAGACPKHFAANSQEYLRFSNDAIVDERTLRELYLPAFERVVRQARPAMVMSSYNKINGTFSSDNAWLLRRVLRGEWGFDGVVVTDWGGMHDRVAAYRAGCDLAMPGGTKHNQNQARKAISAGTLDVALVRESAERVVRLARREEAAVAAAGPNDAVAHHALALRAATEGAVLLKNDGVLPVPSGKKVALIGAMAVTPRYQGAGSSRINPRKLVSLWDAVQAAGAGWTYVPGCKADGTTNEDLLAEATSAAAAADVAVVVVGLPDAYEGEGFDRKDMEIPQGHVRLVQAVAAANSATVVLVQAGSPVVCPWEDQVAAVLNLGLGGEAGGQAAFDLLTGVASPSGHLPETWPLSPADAACDGCWGEPHRQSQFREGLYVGYRYYETAQVPVRHPFGYGLSYTTFAYSDLVADQQGVSFTLTNTGARKGAEVAQVYVTPPAGGPYRPARWLAGFARVELAPGESLRVRVDFDDRTFAVWADGAWRVPQGTYGVVVARDAHDASLATSIDVEGEDVAAPVWQAGTWYEAPTGKPTQADLEAALGHAIAPEHVGARDGYTEEDTLREVGIHSLVGRVMIKAMEHVISKPYGYDLDDPTCHMIIASSIDCSLFGIQNSSGGAISPGFAAYLLRRANAKRGR